MTDRFFPKGAEKLLRGQINVVADTVKVALIPQGYTFSTTHEFLSSIGTPVGTAQTLANKTVTGGVLDADDVSFGALASGSTIAGVVLYKDTGNASTSPLLAIKDQGAGLPFATSGAVFGVQWSGSSSRIFSLAAPGLNHLYPKGAEKIWLGQVNFEADPIKAALLPAGYTPAAAHEFLSDVGSTIGTAQALTSVTAAGGVFDAADLSFGAVSGGATAKYLLLYKDTGTAATSPLLAVFEQVDGFPLTMNGSVVDITWPNTASKIISLL